ncbi:MAG: TlpA family protein disulfide reductase [Actinomycetia bacterium]|nr:TlpA family protein disulfide reductase [Actinomycetes bacterium]
MRRTTSVCIAVLLAAPLLLSLAGCTGSDAQVDSSGGQGFVAGDGSAQVIDSADREAAPDLVGTTLNGDDLALSGFAGDVVVLNLWASWCGPCRAEAPALQQVYTDSRKMGVEFLGINSRDQEAAAAAFEKNFGITYPSLVDESGELQLAFHDSVPASSIPWTLVIDRDGLIAARVVGPTTYSQLSDLVDEVVAER